MVQAGTTTKEEKEEEQDTTVPPPSTEYSPGQEAAAGDKQVGVNKNNVNRQNCDDTDEDAKTEPRGLGEGVTTTAAVDNARPAPSQPQKVTASSSRHSRGASGDGGGGGNTSRIGALYRKTASGRIGLARSSRRLLAAAASGNTTDRPEGSTTASAIHVAFNENGRDKTLNSDPEDDDVTWGKVLRSCCCHSRSEWAGISVFIFLLLLTLYFFLVGLDLLSTGFKVAQGCTAGTMLGSDTNPLASLLIGIIATALLQSSSTTTAIVVSLVSGGLDVKQGIYIVMGANIGTSVTAMLVSLAHTRDGEELERAFAGSSVYYVFNFATAVVLLPLEVATGYLYHLTKIMLPSSVGEGESWEGPIRTIVQPVVKSLIIADKDLIADISTGEVESCSDLYPVYCIDGVESYEMCNQTGLIACNKDTGKCPAFFQNGASKKDDIVSAYIALLVGLFLLIICLIALVALLHQVLAGASVPIIYKATNINPYLAMVIGCGVTVLVQSSSITTSTLVPLAGVGILPLENMYPLVLGADIGTTFTALMAALVSSKVQSLQIALAHLFFNVTGIILWYPIPITRRFVIRIAAWLGMVTRHWRGFPVVFICFMFFGMPLTLLGISSCFEQDTKGFKALGTFLVLIVALTMGYVYYWWTCRGGKEKFQEYIRRRQRRAAAWKALADDIDFIKVDLEWCRNEIGRIKDFAGRVEFVATHGGMGEEGRPMVVLDGSPREDDRLTTQFTTAAGNYTEDDLVSLYESCHSRPWRSVLNLSTGSFKANLDASSIGPITF